MFINSSNTIKSKILQAAIEIDEDYKEYIQSRESKNSNTCPLLIKSKKVLITKSSSQFLKFYDISKHFRKSTIEI